MPLKTPHFWQEKGLAAKILLPLAAMYGAARRLKSAWEKPYKSALPVLCVGGVVAGGSGKTPVTHALLALIRKSGVAENPVILTRGYGGALKGPTFVDETRHGVDEVGDEALLHASHAPVVVSRDRAAGARLAEGAGADLIVMDDGLQNGALRRDVSFLVIDSGQKLGNGYMIPAGPLREPLESALKKCRAVIEIGGASGIQTGLPRISASTDIVSTYDKSLSYFGFAGLGQPEKFRQTLIGNGFQMTGFQGFADHHRYTDGDMQKLIRMAGAARLITTEKDITRVPGRYRGHMDVLKISIAFEDAGQILAILQPLRTPA